MKPWGHRFIQLQRDYEQVCYFKYTTAPRYDKRSNSDLYETGISLSLLQLQKTSNFHQDPFVKPQWRL